MTQAAVLMQGVNIFYASVPHKHSWVINERCLDAVPHPPSCTLHSINPW